jgi:2-polyprenyl-3-methyl-5-hydroxy-6-metoxy-1,4-benzoquinol methylase
MLPNDTKEQKRLNLQHQIFRLSVDGELNLAPVAGSPRVLDLGCGAGIVSLPIHRIDPITNVEYEWAIDFAKEHPDATIVVLTSARSNRRIFPKTVASKSATWKLTGKEKGNMA